MTTAALTFWLTLMLLGFAGSALFSGLETGCYRLNRVRLHVRARRNERAAIRLERMLADPAPMLSTLLIGNNIFNYMGTASLAVMLSASGLNQTQQIILNVLLVTPILFVLGETLPKDLFSAHADGLMYRLYGVLVWSGRLFTWLLLVPIVGLFSIAVMRVMGQQGGPPPFHPRRRVGDLVKESVGSGLLSDQQSRMVDRVLGAAGMEVASRMIPWRQVLRIKPGDTTATIVELSRSGTQALMPVVDAAGKVQGMVAVIDALRAARSNTGGTAQDLMVPAKLIAGDLPLRRALAELSRDAVDLAVVANRAGQPLGLISPEALLEPITGPLPR